MLDFILVHEIRIIDSGLSPTEKLYPLLIKPFDIRSVETFDSKQTEITMELGPDETEPLTYLVKETPVEIYHQLKGKQPCYYQITKAPILLKCSTSGSQDQAKPEV